MALSVPPSRFTSRVGGGSAFYVRRHSRVMKTFVILLLALPTFIAGCATGSQTQTSVENWDSLPRLERIVRDYAKRHPVDFDFTNTHPVSFIDPSHTNTVTITFVHDWSQPVYAAKINRNDRVIDYRIITPMEIPADQPPWFQHLPPQ